MWKSFIKDYLRFNLMVATHIKFNILNSSSENGILSFIILLLLFKDEPPCSVYPVIDMMIILIFIINYLLSSC